MTVSRIPMQRVIINAKGFRKMVSELSRLNVCLFVVAVVILVL